MKWVESDGGRRAAGYKGTAGDCGTRAVAIALEITYAEAYLLLNESAKHDRLGKRMKRRSSARNGVHRATMDRLLWARGWEWVPTMFVGKGCQVHMRARELPKGRLIVRLSKHFAAMIDGVVYDTYDPTREGTRCVYGYWRKGLTSKPT